MRVPLTPREAVVALVEDYAAATGVPTWKVWKRLYGGFEYQTNWNLRREAGWNGSKPLDFLEETRRIGELMSFAEQTLKIPALPEKEKSPASTGLYH